MVNEIKLLEDSIKGDISAFEKIIKQYQSTVCAITLSGTGRVDISEDLAQETFLNAWKNLSTLKDLRSFKSWLYTIAHNVINNHYRKKTSDLVDPATITDLSIDKTDPSEELIRNEEHLMLQQALMRIPAAYREPLVMFYRQQKSVRQVASALDLNEATVRTRMHRAKQMLREEMAVSLERTLERTAPAKAFTRSVTVLIAAAAAAKTMAAASTAAVVTTSAAGASSASAGAGAIFGTLTAKLISVAAAIAVCAGGLIVYNTVKHNTNSQSVTIPTSNNQPLVKETPAAQAQIIANKTADAQMQDVTQEQPAPNAAADQFKTQSADQSASAVSPPELDEDNTKQGFLGIKAVDEETGLPIVGATFKSDSNIKTLCAPSRKTNSFGRLLYQIGPAKINFLSIEVSAKGYVSKYLQWQPANKGIPVPKQYLLQMKKSVPAGGFVKTKDGLPIQDVSIMLRTSFDSGATEQDYVKETAKTNKEGYWHIADFDRNAINANVELTHDSYVSTQQYSLQPDIDLLLNKTCVLFMQKGLTVSGYVRDSKGKPIEGATLYEGWSHFIKGMVQKTDPNGFYKFANCTPQRMVLTVMAKGFAPDLKNFSIEKDLHNIDFVLEPGCRLALKVIDTFGNPVQDAKIEGRCWRHFDNGQKCESIRCSAKTNADGKAVLEDLPSDEILYVIRKPGFAELHEFPLTASKDEQVVTLWPQGKLKGIVYDAQSREVIRQFRMTEGIDWQGQNKPTWQDSSGGKFFDNGEYGLAFDYHAPQGFAVKIEADGYLPYESKTYYNEGKEVIFNVYLTKGNKFGNSQIAGTVYDPNGIPAKNADVLVCPKGGWVRIRNGRFEQTSHMRLTTNASGEFVLPPQKEEYLLIFLHESGFAQMTKEVFRSSSQVHLTRWARLTGTLYSGRKPAVNKQIIFQSQFGNESRDFQIVINTDAFSDEKGCFSIHRVFPGRVTVSKGIKLADNSMRYETGAIVNIDPGQTKQLHIGGGGRTVTGLLLPPTSLEVDLTDNEFEILPDLTRSFENQLDLSALPEMRVPLDFFMKTPQQMQEWQAQWMQTPEGKACMEKSMEIAQKMQIAASNHAVVVDQKGKFTIADLLPGSYKAKGKFRDFKKKGQTPDYYNSSIAQVEFTLTVEDTDSIENFDKPVNIGSFQLKASTSLEIGQIAPAVIMKTLEGVELSLNDFKDKYILLDLAGYRFLSCSNPEITEQLKKAYTRYKDSNLHIISIIGSAGYPQSWTSVKDAINYMLKQKAIEWDLVFEDTPFALPGQMHKNYSVQGRPAQFVLIAPDGKVLEIIMETDALLPTIEKYFSNAK